MDLPMQSIDCMVSQRLIESEDFSLDSQIMHAASSQPEGLGWPGHSISPPAAYHSCCCCCCCTARPILRIPCMRHETEKNFGPFRSFQPQAESGGCVVLSGHLAAMMGTPGRPGGVEVGYPPRTPAQARVCTAPGDVPAPCPRSPRGYRSMVRVAIGSAIHHFSLFYSRPVAKQEVLLLHSPESSP